MSDKISFTLSNPEAEVKRLMDTYGVNEMRATCYMHNHDKPCMCSLCNREEDCKRIMKAELGFWKRFWWKVNKKIYEMI